MSFNFPSNTGPTPEITFKSSLLSAEPSPNLEISAPAFAFASSADKVTFFSAFGASSLASSTTGAASTFGASGVG
jgi:hypothetical protein